MTGFLPYGRHHIDENDIEAVVRVLRSGALTQGPEIARFERRLAEYVGARFAVAVSNGTAALHIACLAAGVREDGLVVTSPITFVASANCASYVGANIAFADIDAETINMDPDALDHTLREKRPGASGECAVIPVHYAGLPCEMTRIGAIAAKHGAKVIEDAAHALGARYPNGKMVGSCCDSLMTTFSFHPVKAIAAGEGGMITTNDEGIYRSLLRLRSHGINKGDDALLQPELAVTDGVANPWYYEMQELGFNFRITDIQCALANSQLARLPEFLDRRRRLAHNYDRSFTDLPWLRPLQAAHRDSSAHHLYPVAVDFSGLRVSRAVMMQKMRDMGVGSQVHYLPVHLHPFYQAKGFRMGDFPRSESFYTGVLSLPLYFDLSDEEQQLVIRTLRSFNHR